MVINIEIGGEKAMTSKNQNKIEPPTKLDKIKLVALFVVGILGLCVAGLMMCKD